MPTKNFSGTYEKPALNPRGQPCQKMIQCTPATSGPLMAPLQSGVDRSSKDPLHSKTGASLSALFSEAVRCHLHNSVSKFPRLYSAGTYMTLLNVLSNSCLLEG